MGKIPLSRSSDDRTDRRAKKRSRRRSPSLERSSRRRRSAIALPRIRLRMSELPLLLLESDVRMEVRVLVVPLGLWPSAVICKGGSRPVWDASSLAWAFGRG